VLSTYLVEGGRIRSRLIPHLLLEGSTRDVTYIYPHLGTSCQFAFQEIASLLRYTNIHESLILYQLPEP
jgi:hypothetical protein